MSAMTRRVGIEYSVNPDDLQQELLEELLRRDGLDLDRAGWRSWITQRAHWRAHDMLRRQQRVSTVDLGPLEDLVCEVQPCAPLDVAGDIARMRGLGLNTDEARILLYIRWGFGDSPAEFAELAGISPAKVRQDKRRGLLKIIGLSALSPSEKQAITAGLRASSPAQAALQLGVEEKVFTDQLRSAAQKIGTAYDEAGKDSTDV